MKNRNVRTFRSPNSRSNWIYLLLLYRDTGYDNMRKRTVRDRNKIYFFFFYATSCLVVPVFNSNGDGEREKKKLNVWRWKILYFGLSRPRRDAVTAIRSVTERDEGLCNTNCTPRPFSPWTPDNRYTEIIISCYCQKRCFYLKKENCLYPFTQL